MNDAPAFPYDDPDWDGATDAFDNADTRDLLQELTDAWDDQTADYLLFSALMHQGTVYSATFLALPHLVALADTLPPERRRTLARFLGGVALHAQLPRTAGGVSLAPGDPWADTPIGRKAARVFRAALPDIARLCEEAFREDPNQWHASGMAAARGDLERALWLKGLNAAVAICPVCGAEPPEPAATRCPKCDWQGPMIAF